MNTSSVKFREISVVFNLILKLVALTIFVKHRTAITICHPTVEEKLRLLYQNHKAYSNR